MLATRVLEAVKKKAKPAPWKVLATRNGQNGGATRKEIQVRALRREPRIITFFSGILWRALPIKGLRTRAEMLKTPIITPISLSVDPSLER
jgi:hypothetical protein